MQFTTFVTTLLFAAASIANVAAAPIQQAADVIGKGPQELIVFNPPITSPKASSAWAMGSEQIVRWTTTDIPESMKNVTGTIVLGYDENDSENLDVDHPLATNFTLSKGSVKVIMPKNIKKRDDYFLVLFGDSGNRSPKFKIH